MPVKLPSENFYLQNIYYPKESLNYDNKKKVERQSEMRLRQRLLTEANNSTTSEDFFDARKASRKTLSRRRCTENTNLSRQSILQKQLAL